MNERPLWDVKVTILFPAPADLPHLGSHLNERWLQVRATDEGEAENRAATEARRSFTGEVQSCRCFGKVRGGKVARR